MPGSGSVSRWDLSTSRYLTARRHKPPQLLPRGRGGLFVFSEFRWDIEQRARPRPVLVKEGGEAQHVRREAFRVSTGDDQTMGLIGLIPFRLGLGFGDGCRASAVAVNSCVSQSHRDEILTLNAEFGHWGFSSWMIPNATTSVSCR
jgi:hypothetical protein